MTQVAAKPEKADLITVEEAMTILRLSDRSIKRRVKAGHLTQVLVTGPNGPERRFSRAEVEALKDSQAGTRKSVMSPVTDNAHVTRDRQRACHP